MTEMRYEATDETYLTIDLPDTDGLSMRATLRGDFESPVAILVHGRPGDATSILPYMYARYAHERGISTLRLNMYGYGEHTRNLVDCTLDTNVDDFDVVVNYVRSRTAGQVYAAGHSYGGLAILASQSKLDGAVLWEPSHGLAWQGRASQQWKYEALIHRVDSMVVETNGKGMVISKAAEAQDRERGDTSHLAANKGYPLKVICADQDIGILTELDEQYIAVADEPKSFVEIKGAGHGFTESDAVMMKLFEETTTWFEQIGNDND